MKERKLGPLSVSSIGLGCMSLSFGYGSAPDREAAGRVLERALDIGYTFFDTATMYGAGANETLIGEVLGKRRDKFVLASKCGLFRNAEGVREISGRPDVIRRQCDDSLRRLRTDVIDLYYLHRLDRTVPIEESVGALGDLVKAGKIRTIGLSEMSASTIRRAHAEHPVTAVQTEYSLWTRNAEIAVLDACRELAITFVAFSPVARGFLTGKLRDLSVIKPGDIRAGMPRFEPDNYAKNLKLLDEYERIAERVGCTPAQLALAWLLARGEDIVPIPGTTSLEHLEENAGADGVELDQATVDELDALINTDTVAGPRYSPAAQVNIDTEVFPSEMAAE